MVSPSISDSTNAINYETSPKMDKLLRKLTTPEKIQKYLDDLPYNKEKTGETCRSPRLVVEYNTAHCFEGALFAAAALRANGLPPLILDLASVRDDDHVIAVYRANGYWGALRNRTIQAYAFALPFIVRCVNWLFPTLSITTT
jgi:hypothetical protein